MVRRWSSVGMDMALKDRSFCHCDHMAWKVHFSRYVPRPFALSSFEGNRVSRCKKRSGTWLSASAPALLSVSSAGNKDCKISVDIHGKLYEEHLASRAKFTWTQEHSHADCISLATPILFVSFCQKSAHNGCERGKFAMRFHSTHDVSAFLSRTQECMAGTSGVALEVSPMRSVTWEEQSLPLLQLAETPNPRGMYCGASSDASSVNQNVKETHSPQETVSNSGKQKRLISGNQQRGRFTIDEDDESSDLLDSLCSFTKLLQNGCGPPFFNQKLLDLKNVQTFCRAVRVKPHFQGTK